MELLNFARQAILTPTGIQDGDIEKIMSRLLSSSVDAADIYFQSSHSESWVMEAGIIKEGSHSIEQGAGVRAVAGEKNRLCL
jgi:Predicted Zn-dependent proteases and their inactivated homologs